MSFTATSRVATERGERYRKQLASHFGNKIEVVEEPAGTVLRWGRLYVTATSRAVTNARYPAMIRPPAARPRPRPR